MRKERIAAIEKVTATFLPAEASAENAAMMAARCVSVMIEERQRLGLPIDTAADELGLLAEGAYHAAQAHVRFVKLHTQLRQLPATIGITNYGTGDCVPNRPFTSATAPLHVVAAA